MTPAEIAMLAEQHASFNDPERADKPQPGTTVQIADLIAEKRAQGAL